MPTMLCCGGSNPAIGDGVIQKDSNDLHYIVREPSGLANHAPVLLLLHGYGSNEDDLFSFSDQIPGHWLIVSVRAPIVMSEKQFRWYDVKRVDGKIRLNFEDEERSRKALIECVDHVVKKYNADGNRVVVAGFSQGANMSLALALTEPDKIHAAGCFSGRFLEEVTPLITKKEALQSKQVFIAHGTEDKMLPIDYANENQKNLQSMGVKVTLSTDEIGHSISSKQLTAFVEWLTKL